MVVCIRQSIFQLMSTVLQTWGRETSEQTLSDLCKWMSISTQCFCTGEPGGIQDSTSDFLYQLTYPFISFVLQPFIHFHYFLLDAFHISSTSCSKLCWYSADNSLNSIRRETFHIQRGEKKISWDANGTWAKYWIISSEVWR